MIENVEDLSTKFDVLRFRKLEALVENQIKLSEVWSFQRIAWKISEGPSQRNRERRWIKEVAIIVQIGTDSGKQVGSAGLT